MRRAGLIVDLFAGGGGASVGIEAAMGRPIDIAINHDDVALAVHRANHPRTRHLDASIWEVAPRAATGGVPVDMLWASPDCTHHSRAKGGKPRQQSIRALADAIIPWAREVRPAVICVENVPEFVSWGPLDEDGQPIKARRGEDFERWLRALRALGYTVEHRVLDASAYGAPTRRRRLFILARCDGERIAWPDPTHGPGLRPLRTAAECIDWSLPCRSIFGRPKPLAEKTLWRIAQGIRRFVLDCPSPFIVKVNHGKRDARTESLAEPLTTVTAERRGHALVSPTLIQTGYGERPGQAARVPGLHKPLGTLVDGQKHALVAAFLAKHYGDPLRTSGGGVVIGKEVEAPLATVTARDHHSLTVACLAKFRGTGPSHPGSASVTEPLPKISAGGIHVAEVRAFLAQYYGADSANGQLFTEPLRSMLAKHRLGLVTVEGVDYQIVDIAMRMLEPHELLRAQFGRFAERYDLSAAKTKAAQVRLIGNSVCPEIAEAIVRANVRGDQARAA